MFRTPTCTAAIVWLTRRYVPGAAGSGIPQVIAVLVPGVAATARHLFVSTKLNVSKLLLTAWGLLAHGRLIHVPCALQARTREKATDRLCRPVALEVSSLRNYLL